MRHFILVIFSLLFSSLAFSAKNVNDMPAKQVSLLAYQAYIFAAPIHEFHRFVSDFHTQMGNTERPINVLVHSPYLAPAGDEKGMCCPNQDTVYSVAHLDMGTQPLVLSIPKIEDRYYTFQITDAFTNNVAQLGTRTIGDGDRQYLLVSPSWTGETPKGMELLRFDTNEGLILLRLLIKDKSDYPALHAVQNKITLVTLQEHNNPNDKPSIEYLPFAKHWKEDSFEALKWLNHYLSKNSVPVHDEGLRAMFIDMNITGAEDFDPKKQAKHVVEGLLAGKALADNMMLVRTAYTTDHSNGSQWNKVPDGQDLKYDNLLRAAITRFTLLPNDKPEAIYFGTRFDNKGQLLDGNKDYMVKLKKAPPVHAFWSLSAYSSPRGRLIKNDFDKYVVNDRSKGLKINDDGSIDLLLSATKPQSTESNWLPVPKGTYAVALRTYLPGEELMNNTFELPPIIEVKK